MEAKNYKGFKFDKNGNSKKFKAAIQSGQRVTIGQIDDEGNQSGDIMEGSTYHTNFNVSDYEDGIWEGHFELRPIFIPENKLE